MTNVIGALKAPENILCKLNVAHVARYRTVWFNFLIGGGKPCPPS